MRAVVLVVDINTDGFVIMRDDVLFGLLGIGFDHLGRIRGGRRRPNGLGPEFGEDSIRSESAGVPTDAWE